MEEIELAKKLENAGQLSKAADYYRLALSRLALGGDFDLRLLIYESLGRIEYELNNFDSSLSLYRNYYELSSSVRGEKDEITLKAAVKLAVLLDELKRHGEAIELFQRALNYMPAAKDPEFYEQLVVRLALSYKELGSMRASVELFQQALNTLLLTSGEKSALVACLQANFAVIRLSQGQLEEARRLSTNSFSVLKQAAPSDDVVLGLLNLELVFRAIGANDKAESILKKLAKEPLVRTNPALLYETLSKLVSINLKKQDYEAAIKLLEEELAAEKHETMRIELAKWLAGTYRISGNPLKAKQLLEKSISRIKDQTDAHRRNTSQLEFELGLAEQDLGSRYITQGEWDKAEQLYTSALASTISYLGARHPGVADLQMELGRIFVKQGKEESGRSLLENALQTYTDTYGTKNHRVEQIANELMVVSANQVEKNDDA